MNDQEYRYLKQKLLSLDYINLDHYKPQQMRRRLEGFVSSQARSVSLFCQMLDHQERVRQKLRKFLTINVTSFFRDPTQFDVLKTRILPDLLRQSSTLNIWSAGCSYGAEAYSVAMLLNELTPGRHHRILGTDIDETVLSRAREGGPYTPSDVENVNKRFLSKHFTVSNEVYWITRSIKSGVEFDRHNLLDDRFEDGFDLIICRNVVIYFSSEARKGIYTRFVRSLTDDGIVFIGATETMLDARELGLKALRTGFYRKPTSKA